MNLAIVGYGQMGKAIEQCAVARGHRISARYDVDSPFVHNDALSDVVIDFSTASAVEQTLSTCIAHQLPCVIGTTGWKEKIPALRLMVESANASVLYGSNFSVGMQMFIRIVQRAAQLINSAEDYDVMLQEIHHKRKRDSPSGTALTLAEILLQEIERKKKIETSSMTEVIDPTSLHITALRGGEVAGTHQVLFDSKADSIELTHMAKNRSGFALGAVLAAEWIRHNKGFYDFYDVFDLVMQNSAQ